MPEALRAQAGVYKNLIEPAAVQHLVVERRQPRMTPVPRYEFAAKAAPTWPGQTRGFAAKQRRYRQGTPISLLAPDLVASVFQQARYTLVADEVTGTNDDKIGTLAAEKSFDVTGHILVAPEKQNIVDADE